MLRATRLVTASKRGFATVVDAAHGFKVAAVDNGQPTSSVTVLLKAGSRYESKPGLAHTLSNFTFKVRLYFFYHLTSHLRSNRPRSSWCGCDVHSRLYAWVTLSLCQFLFLLSSAS